MNMEEILAKCDHTLLTQTATWAEIRAICVLPGFVLPFSRPCNLRPFVLHCG